MPSLMLYHTSACHLCEEAEALTTACLSARGMPANCLHLEDITSDEGLLERYGLIIPVLRLMDTGQELLWPFGLAEIEHFLNTCDT